MKILIKKPTKEEISQAKLWPVWSKEKSTFDWSYSDKETCLIIEGKARVKSDEETVEFGPGDWIEFPKGLDCTWEIIEDIKKHYKFG